MINIGSDVWIRSDSVVGSDIGNWCVIEVGSIVL